ncbi:MAG TPA: universal stress protein [Pyrinomonadaceae bacterium]|nr:universal stress protein [Pyrinomonadaceae bacterium]
MSKVLNFERILCPVAESHETDEGLLYAIALARSYGAKLFVLTCSDDSSRIDSHTVDAMQASIKKAVEHSCVLFPCEVAGGHLDYEFVVTESSRPADSIKHEAEKQNADLIVMSSRRRPYAAALLGSTAEAVCRTASCPVLVTRSGEGHHLRSAIRALEFKKLLVASDFSSDSELALRYGLSLAQEYQSELHLLHVLTDSKTSKDELAWTSQSAEGPYHVAARQLHRSVPAETHLWCDVTHVVREGKAHREIVSYAVEQEINLILIGAHGQGFKLGTLFGSNTDRVLRESPCPVLVVRPLKPAARSVGLNGEGKG